MTVLKELDIIVPVKNEAKTAEELVRRVDHACRTADISYRLIVVDDRSTDETVARFGQLSQTFPIVIHQKQGKGGKAFSIIEGARLARTSFVAMIDGDLQYPPEALPEMIKLAPQHGVVVANRKVYRSHLFRKVASRLNAWLFGKFLFGFKCDIQSGLKVFRRELIGHLDQAYLSAWTLDLPLLHAAEGLGYTIGSVDITFTKRKNGDSKIGLFRTACQIGYRALKLKMLHDGIFHFRSSDEQSMLGAGIAYKKQRFVTHSHLRQHQSALVTFKTRQKLFFATLFIALVAGLVTQPLTTAITIIAILSVIYFSDVVFNLILTFKGLERPPELLTTERQLKQLDPKTLPMYSILCPLYKEAHMLPEFVAAIAKLDWPKDRLEVLLLLEAEDEQTIAAAGEMTLPAYFKIVVVPRSLPQTKPKACNYGLAQATGEYVVIYDAEDRPDPLQLKKAYLGFQFSHSDVACLQAKLNYHNPHHNLLTKLFTAEYSLWFDVILPGLQSIRTSIPLGGTSNHFKTKTLKELHGWDAFNVTEDCDLGVRLYTAGFKTAIIDSVTWEEANSHVGNWIRQRSRWLKGYLQTYLVHMRNPWVFFRRHGVHAVIFQLIVGLRISFILINPILWAATIAYFTLYRYVGPTIEALYPTAVFYVAGFSLLVGNFTYLYNYMIGLAKREHWGVIKYVFLVPLYWLLMGVAALMAIFQLIFKPHYWEKTHHGFHLAKEEAARERKLVAAQAAREERRRYLGKLATSGMATGGILVVASVIANLLNFVYNAYLGRTLNLEDFGLLSVFGSIFYLTQSAFSSLSATVTHRSAYLLGKYQASAKTFWQFVRKRAAVTALILTLAWVAVTPVMAWFFHSESVVPFLLFTPVWLVGILVAVDMGFLSGNLKFGALGAVAILGAIAKLGLAALIVNWGYTKLVYAAVPLSLAASFGIAWILARRIKGTKVKHVLKEKSFPTHFLLTSLLIHLSTITFLSLDVVLAKHYLPAEAAGQYALLALAGKMIFFGGSLFGGFMNPLVSRAIGAGRTTENIFYKLLGLTMVISGMGFLGLGAFGSTVVPLLLGEGARSITAYLPVYAFGIACFTIASSIVSYHQVKKHYLFAALSFVLGLFQVVGISLFHANVEAITLVVATLGIGGLALMLGVHLTYDTLVTLGRNIADFWGLFGRVATEPRHKDASRLRILIFNWRDTKHVWAGGAEVYIQELAKRWVAMGHKVTVFCGNDGHNPRNEVIDGVQMIRRGGFFMVYVWAFLYYVLRLRGKFDVVIDSENGVPFFTPLFVRAPVFLLVYHVHQEIFRENLKTPFSWIAMFLEKKLVPLFYRQAEVLTISESTKKAIMRHGISQKTPIVIQSGIDLSTYVPGKKSSTPLAVYVGRLKTYKNLPVLIHAMKELSAKLVPIKLVIAGDGEDRPRLEKLVAELGLNDLVKFVGKISEAQKIKLYQKAWVAVNPSSMEGWGITSIEANACGTPVVASDVPGLRDSVRNPHSGYLVNYQDPSEFADRIFRIVANRRLRQDLSRNAREWASQFTWDESAEKALGVLKHD